MAISISISEFKRCTRTHMRSPETTWTSHQNLRTRSVVQEATRSFPDMNSLSYRRLPANFWFSVRLTRTEIKLSYCASLLDFPIVVGPSGASVVGRSSVLQLLLLHCKFMAKSFWATVHHVTMSTRAGFKACCSSWRPGWYPHTCHTKCGRFQSLRGGHECTMIFLLCVSNDYFVRFTCWCGGKLSKDSVTKQEIYLHSAGFSIRRCNTSTDKHTARRWFVNPCWITTGGLDLNLTASF